MSATWTCDTCDTTIRQRTDAEGDWIHVDWGLGRNTVPLGDYCTTACASVALEKARDENAALMLAAMDDDTESL